MSSGHDDFQTTAVMRGAYAGEQITLAVDALGRLRVLRVNVSDLAGVHGDLDGLDANDHPQYRLAGDIDHGALVGLSDYDHDQYIRKNLSQAITGAVLKRNVDDDLIQVHGGTGGGGTGADIRIYGANHPTLGGDIYVEVPNAAKNSTVLVDYIEGNTDNPVRNFNARRLTNVADPINPQDVVTLSSLPPPAAGVPSRMIMAWNGSIASIPAGYLLCNGLNSTPDLRDRFIVGAGNLYAYTTIGGSKQHVLTVSEMPAHTHDYVDREWGSWGASGTTHTIHGSTQYRSTLTVGGGDAHNNLPPYYALAWVMQS